jgi:aminoglycoside phosphotransferase (APT) family kinase protein
LETRPDELARCNDPQLAAASVWLDARLRAASYQTLVHGDAKVENFCFTSDLARVAAVDFQYAGAGCGIQDVAYFFSSCLSDQLCETRGPELLDFYFEVLGQALARHQPNIDARALEAEWRELYPVAWADFARFLSGWAPGHDSRSGYAGRMTKLALEAFAAAR